MTNISQYHRHQALALCADLPEDIEDARAVLAAMHTLVEGFLADADEKDMDTIHTPGGAGSAQVVPLR